MIFFIVRLFCSLTYTEGATFRYAFNKFSVNLTDFYDVVNLRVKAEALKHTKSLILVGKNNPI